MVNTGLRKCIKLNISFCFLFGKNKKEKESPITNSRTFNLNFIGISWKLMKMCRDRLNPPPPFFFEGGRGKQISKKYPQSLDFTVYALFAIAKYAKINIFLLIVINFTPSPIYPHPLLGIYYFSNLIWQCC